MNFWEIFLPCFAALWLICSLILVPHIIFIFIEKKRLIPLHQRIINTLIIFGLGPIAIGFILTESK